MYTLQLGYTNPKNQIFSTQKELEDSTLESTGKTFLRLANSYIRNGGNPNLVFPTFSIGDNSFRNLTYFQLIYIYWKSPGESWSEEVNTEFERIVDLLLDDARTDVKAKLTEYSLSDSEHFFNTKMEAYFRQREEEGYLLEGASLAHYAMAIEDFEMVDKLLRKAPELLHENCCLVKGKNLLHQEVMCVFSFENAQEEFVLPGNEKFRKVLDETRVLDNDDTTSGVIAQGSVDIKLTEGSTCSIRRITRVSLMHIAARCGNEAACGYFRGQKANFVSKDSDKLTPFDYLKLSLEEGLISESTINKRLFKMLEPVVRLNKPCLPECGMMLRREGYKLLYDTRTKVANYAYERLTPESLKKNSDRSEGGSFKIDREVPDLNRGKSADYTNTGYDKGHLAAAANAVASDRAMEDTFLFTNACPQNPQLNQQYWKALEGDIRKLANDHDLTEVFTGCLFLANANIVHYQTIGKGQVSVPTHLFKVIYLYKGLAKKEMAYLIPNSSVPFGTPYNNFLCSIDQIQELSGILFNQWRPKPA